VKAACGLIDITAALVVFGYCAVAFFTVVRYGDRRKAHSLVAQGALLGLSIKVIAALLKTVELQSWNQIGIFFVIFLLKNLLKRIFVAEDKLSKAEELQSL
jgi:hypothetical protein